MSENPRTGLDDENSKYDRIFKRSSEMPALPPNFSLWDHRYELSEILRSSGNFKKSFRLQASIVNVSSQRYSDTREISEFYVQSITENKMTQTEKILPSNFFENRPKSKLFSSHTEQEQNSNILEAEDNYKLNDETKADDLSDMRKPELSSFVCPVSLRHAKRDLPNMSFDSEPENEEEFQPNYVCIRPTTQFIKKKYIHRIEKRLDKAHNQILELSPFIKGSKEIKYENKVYHCKFCFERFEKRTALGGHVAKKHPKKSCEYRKRLDSSNTRKIERERINYLRGI